MTGAPGLDKVQLTSAWIPIRIPMMISSAQVRKLNGSKNHNLVQTDFIPTWTLCIDLHRIPDSAIRALTLP